MAIATTQIEVRNNRAGQPRAYVGTTRTRVIDIYVLSEVHGESPSEIAEAFPHLTLAQIHAALSYLLDHREEIVQQYNQEMEIAEESRKSLGPGPLEQYLLDRGIDRDSISS
jgi:uncharacterized protein (DUF433 family)